LKLKALERGHPQICGDAIFGLEIRFPSVRLLPRPDSCRDIYRGAAHVHQLIDGEEQEDRLAGRWNDVAAAKTTTSEARLRRRYLAADEQGRSITACW